MIPDWTGLTDSENRVMVMVNGRYCQREQALDFADQIYTLIGLEVRLTPTGSLADNFNIVAKSHEALLRSLAAKDQEIQRYVNLVARLRQELGEVTNEKLQWHRSFDSSRKHVQDVAEMLRIAHLQSNAALQEVKQERDAIVIKANHLIAETIKRWKGWGETHEKLAKDADAARKTHEQSTVDAVDRLDNWEVYTEDPSKILRMHFALGRYRRPRSYKQIASALNIPEWFVWDVCAQAVI